MRSVDSSLDPLAKAKRQ